MRIGDSLQVVVLYWWVLALHHPIPFCEENLNIHLDLLDCLLNRFFCLLDGLEEHSGQGLYLGHCVSQRVIPMSFSEGNPNPKSDLS